MKELQNIKNFIIQNTFFFIDIILFLPPSYTGQWGHIHIKYETVYINEKSHQLFFNIVLVIFI